MRIVNFQHIEIYSLWVGIFENGKVRLHGLLIGLIAVVLIGLIAVVLIGLIAVKLALFFAGTPDLQQTRFVLCWYT
jgi:hypothetical protein